MTKATKNPAFSLEPGGILKEILKATRRAKPAIVEAQPIPKPEPELQEVK
jgi:hypothetical protein